MNDRIDSGDLHARLVAVLLGEAGADETRAVEALLERDPELRAQRDRLRQTIAAVKDAFPAADASAAPERLSEASRARVLAAAARPARRGVTLLFAARCAAAAVLVVGAALLLRMGGWTWEESSQLAMDTERDAPAHSEARDLSPATPSLGYTAEFSAAPVDPNMDVRAFRMRTPASAATLGTEAAKVAGESLELRGSDLLKLEQQPAPPAPPEAASATTRQTDRGDPSRGPGDTVPPAGSGTGSAGFLMGPGRRSATALPAGATSPAAAGNVVANDERFDFVEEETGLRGGDLETLSQLGYGGGASERGRRRNPPSADDILRDCRRRPDETPSMMFFRFWGDNPFERTALDRQSTFAVDVDTASYALARRYLDEGVIPPKEAIRTEEFVNYFAPDLAPPPADAAAPFAIHLDAAPSLFGSDAGADGARRWMLRVGLRGKVVERAARSPQRLTFVVDCSGSMQQDNRIELVKHGIRLLLGQLDARDAVAIVKFQTTAELVLPMTNATDRAQIEAALYALSASGSTNAEAGLKIGYAHAAQHRDVEAVNRVVLLSDGVANTGQTDQQRIGEDVRAFREQGIYLNTVGVGMGNMNDAFLEQLADRGDGVCNYVDSPEEAKRALVDNFMSAVTPIARDVKVQVEFDPAQVARYRLLGYENRAIADPDFRNDAVDAGELGSGHQVVALYELEPAIGAAPGTADGPFATVRLRWKPPHDSGQTGAAGAADAASEIAASIDASKVATEFAAAPAGHRRAMLVAQFAEFLRRSVHARDDSIDRLLAEARAFAAQSQEAEFHEFVALVEKSRALILERLGRYDDLARAVDALRENCILQAQVDDLAQADAADLVRQIEEQNRRLEERIRRLLEEKLGK